MRLTELEPVWLTLHGKRIGFAFRSPTNPDWLQSCMFAATKMSDQFDAAQESLPRELWDKVQLCDRKTGWQVTGEDFTTMSVTPSLDGSAGGLWHGFITNGEVT